MNSKLIVGLALVGIAGYMLYKKKEDEKNESSSIEPEKPEPKPEPAKSETKSAKLKECEKSWNIFRRSARFSAGTDLETAKNQWISSCLQKPSKINKI